jgi:hypothetical protein
LPGVFRARGSRTPLRGMRRSAPRSRTLIQQGLASPSRRLTCPNPRAIESRR